jgi:formate hydrogenlyase subunit 3/multisubunit Na+/H+ antiporter MnhD subunit
VYAIARPRISALLAGLISKLAVLVIVRLLVVAYADSDALILLLVLGILGIIWGELSAWRAKDLKRMFAFSSIGQLGMVLVAFSIPGEAGMFAGIAMMLHHLLVKPALFMLTDNWSGSIASLSGAAKQSPLAAVLFILFALSLIGVPPFPGFWAKLIMVTGLVGADAPLYLLALGILLTATVIEANYLIRCAIQIYAPADENSTASVAQERLSLAISSALGIALMVSLFTITPLGNRLYHVAAEAADKSLYINTTLAIGQMPAMRTLQ